MGIIIKKELKESHDIDINVDYNTSVSSYIVRLQDAYNDEVEAIRTYEEILEEESSLSAQDREDIEEILSDEKDHLVILSRIIKRSTEEEFKGYGDK